MVMLLVWGSYFQGHCIRVTPLASPGPALTFPQGKRHIFLSVPYGPISGLPALSIPVGSCLALKFGRWGVVVCPWLCLGEWRVSKPMVARSVIQPLLVVELIRMFSNYTTLVSVSGGFKVEQWGGMLFINSQNQQVPSLFLTDKEPREVKWSARFPQLGSNEAGFESSLLTFSKK